VLAAAAAAAVYGPLLEEELEGFVLLQLFMQLGELLLAVIR
jgi:hypothetical protein